MKIQGILRCDSQTLRVEQLLMQAALPPSPSLKYNRASILITRRPKSPYAFSRCLWRSLSALPRTAVIEVQVQVPANSVSEEASLPGLQMAAFLLCLHMAFPLCMCVCTHLTYIYVTYNGKTRQLNVVKLSFPEKGNIGDTLESLVHSSSEIPHDRYWDTLVEQNVF